MKFFILIFLIPLAVPAEELPSLDPNGDVEYNHAMPEAREALREAASRAAGTCIDGIALKTKEPTERKSPIEPLRAIYPLSQPGTFTLTVRYTPKADRIPISDRMVLAQLEFSSGNRSVVLNALKRIYSELVEEANYCPERAKQQRIDRVAAATLGQKPPKDGLRLPTPEPPEDAAR